MILKHFFCTVRLQLQETLQKQFTPSYLTIINESNLHSVPKGSETHFKITLVSDKFINQSHIQRHRAIYNAINDENYKIHAIQITAKSQSEWNESQYINPSPSCRGGSKVK